ncbi:PIN domain-containing protein [Candidatus Woesearchaeota archaeon]|nr:PIN domain-containing protein [Candidatus Woesearchaeota archaeon]
MKYFIDTCIWRDFYEDRLSRTRKPIGKYAGNFIMRIIENKDTIIFSYSIIWELKRFYSEEQINEILNFFKITRILEKIETTIEEKKEARIISQERNLPFVDCLIAIQARNHNALLVSRDKHYDKLRDIAKTVKP